MYRIEVTDTFAGEANYCWVKRVAGWQGWCRVRLDSWCGDTIVIRPTDSSGICQIAFAIWED